jgi:hypothetical protein
MSCFVNLVKSQFLRNASIELHQAQRLILTTNTNPRSSTNPPTVTHWSFKKKVKKEEFQNVWIGFGMDEYIDQNEDFFLEDYLSIVEGDEVSILCSLSRRLIDESTRHYHHVYGDWCYHRTKKKIRGQFVYIALMWKAFPTTAFSLN